jgi:fatty acid/phospholipid biosynthesis enzyme
MSEEVQPTDMQSPLQEAHKILEQIRAEKESLAKAVQAFNQDKANAMLAGKSWGTPPTVQLSEDEKTKLELQKAFKGTALGSYLK